MQKLIRSKTVSNVRRGALCGMRLTASREMSCLNSGCVTMLRFGQGPKLKQNLLQLLRHPQLALQQGRMPKQSTNLCWEQASLQVLWGLPVHLSLLDRMHKNFVS